MTTQCGCWVIISDVHRRANRFVSAPYLAASMHNGSCNGSCDVLTSGSSLTSNSTAFVAADMQTPAAGGRLHIFWNMDLQWMGADSKDPVVRGQQTRSFTSLQ